MGKGGRGGLDERRKQQERGRWPGVYRRSQAAVGGLHRIPTAAVLAGRIVLRWSRVLSGGALSVAVAVPSGRCGLDL